MNAALKAGIIATLVTLALQPNAAYSDTGAEWLAIASRAGDYESRAAIVDRVRDALRRITRSAGGGADRADYLDAANAVAAFAVLEHLAPTQREELEMHLAIAFSRIPENDAKAAGAVAGRRAATEVLEIPLPPERTATK